MKDTLDRAFSGAKTENERSLEVKCKQMQEELKNELLREVESMEGKLRKTRYQSKELSKA
jgi:hypothetical protein